LDCGVTGVNDVVGLHLQHLRRWVPTAGL
jgi:hypothetical protein